MLFTCPTCRNKFVSDAKAENLTCPYCGTTYQVGSNSSAPTMSAPVFDKLDEAVKAHADKEQKIIEERGLRPVFRRSQADQLSDQLFFQGILDRQNEVIIPPRDYSLIGEFHNGLAKAKRKESKLFGFVDRIGNEVIPCTWKSAGDFSEYFAGVQDVVSGKCGYIDLTGKLVIPYVWANCWPFHEGYAKMKDDSGKIGAIDKTGNIVVPCVWAAMGDFSEGLAGVKDDNGRCGYVDATGKLVIPCTWGEAWTFQDNVAVVQDCSTKLLGFIDKKGKQLTPCRWKKIERFKDGLCKVSESNFLFSRDKWITIDKNGCVLM